MKRWMRGGRSTSFELADEQVPLDVFVQGHLLAGNPFEGVFNVKNVVVSALVHVFVVVHVVVAAVIFVVTDASFVATNRVVVGDEVELVVVEVESALDGACPERRKGPFELFPRHPARLQPVKVREKLFHLPCHAFFITPLLLPHHSFITPSSLLYHSSITPPSLHHSFITPPSLLHHSSITPPSLFHHSSSLLYHFSITLPINPP